MQIWGDSRDNSNEERDSPSQFHNRPFQGKKMFTINFITEEKEDWVQIEARRQGCSKQEILRLYQAALHLLMFKFKGKKGRSAMSHEERELKRVARRAIAGGYSESAELARALCWARDNPSFPSGRFNMVIRHLRKSGKVPAYRLPKDRKDRTPSSDLIGLARFHNHPCSEEEGFEIAHKWRNFDEIEEVSSAMKRAKDRGFDPAQLRRIAHDMGILGWSS